MVVRECPIELNGFPTIANLNVLHLGSYDALICMDWLEKHKANVDRYNKVFECTDIKGTLREVRGIHRPILVRKIFTLQLRKFFKNNCQIYVVHIIDSEKEKWMRLEDYELLQEYVDVFP